MDRCNVIHVHDIQGREVEDAWSQTMDMKKSRKSNARGRRRSEELGFNEPLEHHLQGLAVYNVSSC
jgi:hypothetical protein